MDARFYILVLAHTVSGAQHFGSLVDLAFFQYTIRYQLVDESLLHGDCISECIHREYDIVGDPQLCGFSGLFGNGFHNGKFEPDQRACDIDIGDCVGVDDILT